MIRHGGLIFLAFALGVAAWGAYRLSSQRFVPSAMTTVDYCSEQQGSAILPDSDEKSVRCEMWDIGTGVSGYVWRSPNPRGAVLLQHGYGDYSFRYVDENAQLIPHLLAHGFDVYAVDMYGNGHSPGDRGVVDPWQAVDDHVAARRKLQEQPLPVFLIGHSLGGLVTATSIVRDQNDVRGVVLLAPALLYDVSPLLRTIAQLGGLLIPTVPAPMEDGSVAGLLSRDLLFEKQLVDDRLMYLGHLPFITASGGATLSNENFSSYPKVTVPVLVIHGTADKVTDPRGSALFIDLIRSHDKSLLEIDDGRHALLDDTGAVELRDTVIAWLEARL